MSVVQPGGGRQSGRGQDSGQRPPAGGRPGGQGGRGAKQQSARGTSTVKGTDPGRGQQGGRGQSPPKGQPGGRSQSTTRAPGQKPGPKPVPTKSKGRRNVPVTSSAPRRISPTAIGFGAVIVIVIVVVALVIYNVTKPSAYAGPGPQLTNASQSVLSEVTGVGPSVMNAVGVPSTSVVAPPSVAKGQPPLRTDGLPGAFWVGAEFCPYCAATRWSVLMAFSRFGTFSNVKETTSSPWDVYPATATFSFHGADYKSKYVSLGKIGESESNGTGPAGAGIHVLDPLTPKEQALQTKYTQYFKLSSEGYPFMDIGNKVFVLGPLYNPAVLQGGVLNQAQIAAKLKNPKDPITQSIVGEANYLTAGICSITNQQPSSVCSVSAVQKAASAMGVS